VSFVIKMEVVSFDDALVAVKKKTRAAEVMTLLKAIRLNRLRESRLVIEYGRLALHRFESSLGDEKWSILEQVFIAALDTGDQSLANECLSKLMIQFRDSSRVKRLVGLQSEAKKEFKVASETYEELLATNPANALAMKRKVALLRAQGKVNEAVQELNKLVDQFSADATAWQELADLYLSLSKYDSAAFCFEELILHDPMNHLLHCRLGEIYFTLGRDHLFNARKYFSQSLEIKRKGNARALHGLASCCHSIAENPKISKEAKERSEVNAALHAFASLELRNMYSDKQKALVGPLGEVLKMQAAAVEEASHK